MKRNRVCVGLVALLMVAPVFGAVRINEICADNKESLLTAAGDAADWIELYNDGGSAVSLEDWSLTDSKSNPRKFVFPSGVSVAPHGYLVVFADGSGTPVQNGEVHANFSLSKSGEYLALIDPGGEAVSAFTFPPQFRDVSYGYAPKEIIPIGDGAPCVFWVPDGSLPQNVVKHNGVGALGFADAQVQGNFTVKYYEMNSNVRHIDTAESMLANPAYWKSGYPVAGQYQTVNFMRSGTTGIFGGYAAFPSLPGSNQEEFVVTAEGGVYVPSPGLWTFAVASDDGFRLRITGHGVSFMSEYEGTRGIQPTFGVFNFPVAGVYSVNLIMFQGNGGAGLEFAVAQGDQQNYNVSTFSLVGGAACPVLHAGAFGALIETNIKTQMDGGAQKRLQMRSEWSFVIDELPDENDAFTLYLRYSDGYQAWLAGTLLGEANIPVPVNPPLGGFHDRSPASVQRPVEDYMTWEVISVPTALLTVGTNTLSVYGLRHSATNENFFLQVRLVQNTKALHLAYFKDPTPGAANAAAHTAPTPAVTISEPHGYKTAPFTATLSCDDPAAVIRYTLNGSVPTKSNSIIYTNPLPVSATTVIRAAVIDPESVFQNTATVSWLFLEQVLTQGFPGSPWPSGSSNGQTYEYTMRSDIRAAYPTEIRTGFTNAIPTLSIVMHQDDFSGATQGIYSNPGNEGIGWERPISLELIDPVRGPQKEFQKNGGLRIRGAQSRSKGNPKHAFRIYFRREYSGDNKLLFPMFDAEGAEEFNRFDLRCTSNGSWGQQNDANETFLRDVYSRDCQRDLGVAYTRSRPYHVFINGVYWGLYETQERPESHYGVTYFGGANKDWDALKTSHSDRNLYAVDGNTDALNALWNCTFPQGGYAPSGSTAGNYMRMLGRNPDGTPNPAYPAYLDETNLIARVLVMHHTADPDSPISDWGGHGNNMAALYNRADPDGFKWFCHDSEFAFGLNGTYNPAYDFTMMGSGFTDLRRFNPNTLHQRLCAHPDYKMHFADQVQKHLLGGGALTIAKSHERWRARMDMLGDAVVPESARWGRGKTVATWSNACNTVLNFMTQREPNLLNHYRQRGWFPALAAPAHDLAAPLVDIGTPVTVSAPGAFYYTLDGSDPRLPGGGVNPAAIAVGNPAAPPSPPVTLLANGSVWKYYDNGNAPANNNGASWKSPAYSDAAWPQGPSTLGFQGSATVNPVATVTKRYVNGTSGAQVTTTYFRHTFNFSGAANVTALNVTMLIDDGAVVYLNGTEVIRYNMNPGTPTYDDYAASNLGSPAQNTYYNYTIPVQHLQEGANVLAAEVHQSNATSTDLYFDFTLSATSAAGGGGGGAPGGGSVTIIAETNHTVMARCYDGAEWSPLTDLAFTTEPPPDYTLLRVSKLMYAPTDPLPTELLLAPDATNRDDYAWLELCNTNPDWPLDLTGVTLEDNITVKAAVLNGVTLPPMGRVFLVKDPAAFAARYPRNTQTALAWSSGNISRSGGPSKPFTLKDPDGAPIYAFTYDGDNWFGGAAKNTGRWLDADLTAPNTAVYSTQPGWTLNGFNATPLLNAEDAAAPLAPVTSDHASHLRVSKLMYAPPDPDPAETLLSGTDNRDHFAWLELCNASPDHALDLTGVTLDDNITVNATLLTNLILPPGGRVYLVKSLAAFHTRYPANTQTALPWSSGNISRSGGPTKPFTLKAPGGALIYAFTYDGDNWFGGAAKNTGRWLDANLNAPSTAAYSTQPGWRLNSPHESPLTPATGEAAPHDEYAFLRVTKLMFAPPAPTPDEILAGGHDNANRYAWLELTNTGTNDLNLGGVLMTNNILCRFGDVTLPPGGRHLVTRQKASFDIRYPEGLPPNDTGLDRKNWDDGNLSASGGEDQPLELYAPDGTLIYAFTYTRDWFTRFAYNTGRWIEAIDPALQDLPLWSDQSAWRLNPVPSDQDYAALRISKFMYGAYSPTEDEIAQGFDNVDHFAWLELYNTGADPVDLANASLFGVTHLFAPYLLQPKERLVVAKNTAAFTARYPADGIALIQWTSGNLSQNGELLELRAPDGAPAISFTYTNDWYSITNTGRYLVATDLTAPPADPWWSTAPAWRPSATTNALPGIPERPLLTGPRLDADGGGSTFRFNVTNLDGLWLDVFYSLDLLDWTLAPAPLWSRDHNAITIDLTHPALQTQDKAFFHLRQR